MTFHVIPKTAVADWVQGLRKSYRVVGPRPLHGQFVFDEITSAQELDLGYPTTVLPPKKYLLPPQETLFHFSAGGGKTHLEQDVRPTVVLGVHTCDLHALQLLDLVFAQGNRDQHYMANRQKAVLVSIECLKPCGPHSFCKSMGTLGVIDGYDLHLTDLGEEYAVDVGTARGNSLLKGLLGVRDGTDADYRLFNRVMGEKWPRFPLRLDFDISELPSLLSTSYDSSLWEELGQRCLACGMCTNVCPTCYCFNVLDEVDFSLKVGRRYRVWDSCQLDRFATVAGGHNFRSSQASRVRHRFFRKGKYQTDAYGLLGCVGCGRCAQACLVHITPVDTWNELNRRRNAASVGAVAKEALA
jgi:sulfhydrogenase subunit beta (sulfur reductase)